FLSCAAVPRPNPECCFRADPLGIVRAASGIRFSRRGYRIRPGPEPLLRKANSHVAFAIEAIGELTIHKRQGSLIMDVALREVMQRVAFNPVRHSGIDGVVLEGDQVIGRLAREGLRCRGRKLAARIWRFRFSLLLWGGWRGSCARHLINDRYRRLLGWINHSHIRLFRLIGISIRGVIPCAQKHRICIGYDNRRTPAKATEAPGVRERAADCTPKPRSETLSTGEKWINLWR